MTDTRRIYWDSDVIIAYLSGDTTRIAALAAIREEVAASEGRAKIIASQISKVEVAYLEKNKKAGTKLSTEGVIDKFWRDDSIIELIEFGENIAIPARSLIRNSLSGKLKTLKPLDAIHLATAIWAKVDEFHTYNVTDFKPYSSYVGFTIQEPTPQLPRLNL